MSHKCRLRSYKNIGNDGKWAADRIEELEKQRDELLAAAKSTVEAFDGLPPHSETRMVSLRINGLRGAIASVKSENKTIDQCAECNAISLATPAECRQCKADAPAFTDAVNAFVKGGANRECGCGWSGHESDCLMCGSVGPLCPRCHETTEVVKVGA